MKVISIVKVEKVEFPQGYILPKKFRFDKRRSHLSSLICSGDDQNRSFEKDSNTILSRIYRLARVKNLVLVDNADVGYYERRVVMIHAVLDLLKIKL